MDKAATGRPHKRALMFLARNVLWLEFVAITMMAIGYWVDKAENYPFIAHLVAPKWAAANEGLTFLLAHKNSDPGPQGQLHADNPGFDELASICWEHLLEHNRHIRIPNGLSITNLRCDIGNVLVGVPEGWMVAATLSNGQVEGVGRPYIEKGISELFKRPVLRWSFWLFHAGLIFGILIVIAYNMAEHALEKNPQDSNCEIKDAAEAKEGHQNE